MRRTAFHIASVFSCALLGQVPALPPEPVWEFAITLGATTEGQLFTPFLVKLAPDGSVRESQPISRLNLIRQIQGRTFSKANRDGEDLFRKHGVATCTLPEDSAHMGFLTDCSTLDDLWRLRFQEYPLKLQEGMQEMTGWAGKPLRPDDRQMLLLGNYGVQHVLDFIKGENLFRLLKDMADEDWVQNYRGGH